MKGKYIIKKDVDAKAFSTKYTRDIYVLKTKIAHVEDKIKVTEIDKQKLKKLEKEKIEKIEGEKKYRTRDREFLERTKQKKEKIYNIQKPILENFKKELGKLTTAYEESVKKSSEKKGQQAEVEMKKQGLKNQADSVKKFMMKQKKKLIN